MVNAGNLDVLHEFVAQGYIDHNAPSGSSRSRYPYSFIVEPLTDLVAIEEAQFFDDGIVNTCNTFADRGREVIASGLDMDFRCEPFGPMSTLPAEANANGDNTTHLPRHALPRRRGRRGGGRSLDL